MIQNARHKAPIISFGLGQSTIDVPIGQTVTVWQSVLYREDTYAGNIAGDELRFEVMDNNQYTIYCDTAGTFDVRVSMSSLDKKINLISNKIILNVIDY